MPLDAAVPALIGIAFLGWAAGMLTFKRSRRWCTTCGETLTCPHCARRASGVTLKRGVRWAPFNE